MAESEMVERIARAIDAALGEEADWMDIDPEFMNKVARAALEAMREPTEAMVYEGYVRSAFAPECRVSSIQFDPKPVWIAMIDAALKP